MAQIIIVDGPGAGTTYELSSINTIGKANHCNIILESTEVRDEQASIFFKDNGYTIVSNVAGEILVNGQPVQNERKLIHGDMITIADVMLLYGEENPGTSSPPAMEENLPSSLESQEGGEIEEDELVEDNKKVSSIKSRQKFYKDSTAAIQGITESNKYATQNMEVLLKVNNAIMAKFEIKDLMKQLLDIMFEVLPADRGTLFLKDKKANKLWPMASKKRKEIEQADKLMASRTIIREVLETKEGVLTKDAMQDERFKQGQDMAQSISAQKIRAAICVPIIGKNEEVIGIIHLDAVRANKTFTEEHLKLVTAIALQASLAIENATLVQQLGEQKRMEQELVIANSIQQQLLPHSCPLVPGVEVYGMMKPAKEVGGDYYDFVTNDNQKHLYICIGDVSGKGVPAGLVMVMARCFFRPLLLSCSSTKKIMEDLNKFLVEDTRKDMFMSMLIIKWDVIENKFYWTGAGHEHLLIYRAAKKTCEAIRAGGIVLGMMKKAERFFVEQTLELSDGDAIVLYTDGATECLNPKGKMFELERLQKAVEKYGDLSAEIICNSIFKELQQHMAGAAQYDDITLVAIKKVKSR